MKQDETFKIPASEIKARTHKIQNLLKNSELDGILVVQRVDLLYFSGTAQNGVLFIPDEGEPLLMIKKYYPRACSETTLKNRIQIQSVKEIPDRIHDYWGKIPRIIGLELDVMPVNEFRFYGHLFPEASFEDASGMILKARMTKSSWEIRQMIHTADLSRRTFEYMRAEIRPGLGEMEFAGISETFARKYGHAGMLRVRNYQADPYPWHVLSGKNSGMLGLLDAPASGSGTSVAFPNGAGARKFREKEPIVIDFGTILNGYHMDETRMFALKSMPQKALDMCSASIDIHNRIIEMIRPGMEAREVFELGAQMAQKNGYAHAYLGPEGNQVSFVGHGIGMELVEPPFLARGKTDILEPGMTFALEPKMVIENEFMAGIESVFQVTETGTELISKVPVEVFIC